MENTIIGAVWIAWYIIFALAANYSDRIEKLKVFKLAAIPATLILSIFGLIIQKDKVLEAKEFISLTFISWITLGLMCAIIWSACTAGHPRKTSSQ